MSCYISSNENRLYAAQENAYGQVPAIIAANRIAVIKLSTKQSLETAERRDKTGSRTFPGFPAGLGKLTNFRLTTYMTNWDAPAGPPGSGALFPGSLGAAAPGFHAAAAGGGATSGLVAVPGP